MSGKISCSTLGSCFSHTRHLLFSCCFVVGDAAMEMTCGALLNQASGFIRLKKFGEAEARCTRLLDCTTPRGSAEVTAASVRSRALHFRGFAR